MHRIEQRVRARAVLVSDTKQAFRIKRNRPYINTKPSPDKPALYRKSQTKDKMTEWVFDSIREKRKRSMCRLPICMHVCARAALAALRPKERLLRLAAIISCNPNSHLDGDKSLTIRRLSQRDC